MKCSLKILISSNRLGALVLKFLFEKGTLNPPIYYNGVFKAVLVLLCLRKQEITLAGKFK